MTKSAPYLQSIMFDHPVEKTLQQPVLQMIAVLGAPASKQPAEQETAEASSQCESPSGSGGGGHRCGCPHAGGGSCCGQAAQCPSRGTKVSGRVEFSAKNWGSNGKLRDFNG